MNSAVCQFIACPYTELNKNTQVLNVDTIEHFVYIYIQPDIAKDFVLYEVSKKSPDTFDINDVPSYFFRENPCWLKMKSCVLSKDPGQHIYRLGLVHKCSKEVISLYFSYIAQTDNPSKPYIYMNSEPTL